ncbi:activating transcription factor 3 [Diaphorina citri]|uniref:Activating transcription factor 3 n=1 Tax=Diaphorina citri TaxID=121845 RepID=A0A3Q0IPF0_DIACI|nr:activating transcription factor 3 [Diaphorina citri]
MYNLNNTGTPMCPQPASSCPKPTDNTPQTPEILNLISCTNPFDNYPPFQSPAGKLISPPDTGSPNGNSSPPQSVQHTCSQIIKEGLKLALQTKRRTSYSSCSESYYQGGTGGKEMTEVSRDSVEEEEDDDVSSCISNGEGFLIFQESEILETQNLDLKSQIQELETQRRRLVDMLSIHKPCCTKKDGVQFSNIEPINIPFIQPFHNSNTSTTSSSSINSNILDSSNVHDTDSMSQEDQPSSQMFSVADTMNLYDESDRIIKHRRCVGWQTNYYRHRQNEALALALKWL